MTKAEQPEAEQPEAGQNAGTIIVGGENLIDFVEHTVVDGIPQYSANPGGSPYNVAIAAARQHANVDYITPISNDRLGKLLSERLTASGVRHNAPVLDDPTSLAVVSLEQGQPTYQFYRNGTAERLITRGHLDNVLGQSPWLFHIGSLALSGGDDAAIWEDFFIACHNKGVVTSLDPNVRPRLIEDRAVYLPRLEKLFQYADIIKLSDEDIAWLYPDMTMDQAFDHLVALSCPGLRVLTIGAEGARAISGEEKVNIAAHPVQQLVDTVGAGDTFMASILVWCADHGIVSAAEFNALSSKNLHNMMAYAAKAAALNCEQQGCNPPVKEALAHD